MKYDFPKFALTAATVAIGLGVSPSTFAQSEDLIRELEMPGVWASVRNGRVEPSGYWSGLPHEPLWTDWAREQVELFDFRVDDPTMGCGQPGMPRLLTVASPMQFRWFDDDLLVTKYESFDTGRLIYFNRPPQPDVQHTPDGYSVAAWEGDSLVVETTHIDARIQDLEGTPGTSEMTTKEVYYLDTFEDGEAAGETSLELMLTLDDPKVFSEPYTWHFRFVRKADWELIPYSCEERRYDVAPSTEPPAQAGATSFEGLDIDGDGALTLEEFSAYPPANREGRTPDMPFGILDLDGNEELTLYEFGRQRGPRFADVDNNSDGYLAIRELMTLSKNMLSVMALDQLDSDDDLKLDVEEWKESGPRWETVESE